MKKIEYDDINVELSFLFGDKREAYYYGKGYVFFIKTQGDDGISPSFQREYYQVDYEEFKKILHKRNFIIENYRNYYLQEYHKFPDNDDESESRMCHIAENGMKFNLLVEKLNLIEAELKDLDSSFKVENYNICDSENSIGLNLLSDKIKYYENVIAVLDTSNYLSENLACHINILNDHDSRLCYTYLEYLKLLNELKKVIEFLKKDTWNIGYYIDLSIYTDRFKKENSYQKVK